MTLFQLPPRSPRDLERLDRFPGVVPPGHLASVESRHPSWEVEETFAAPERRGAACGVMGGANLPRVLRATAGSVSIRLHGPDRHHLHAGSHSEDDLRRWSGRIGERRSQGRDVFTDFNDDGHGHAARNASRLGELVGS